MDDPCRGRNRGYDCHKSGMQRANRRGAGLRKTWHGGAEPSAAKPTSAELSSAAEPSSAEPSKPPSANSAEFTHPLALGKGPSSLFPPWRPRRFSRPARSSVQLCLGAEPLCQSPNGVARPHDARHTERLHSRRPTTASQPPWRAQENCTFPLWKRLIVDGTYITEVHLVARVGERQNKLCFVSFWAAELNDDNWGWKVVNGSCDGRHFKLGKGGSKRCEDLSMAVQMSSATFSGRNWSVAVRALPTKAIEGPSHRLDFSFNLKGDYAARNLPHGIFGQSFSSAKPLNGKRDWYPRSGRFTTSAMAEGAIEGNAAMYEVSSIYATDFSFSRFNAHPEKEEFLRPELISDRTAAASDANPPSPPAQISPPSSTPPRHRELLPVPAARDPGGVHGSAPQSYTYAGAHALALAAESEAGASHPRSFADRLEALEKRLGLDPPVDRPSTPVQRLRALEAFADITPSLPALELRLHALEGWAATAGI